MSRKKLACLFLSICFVLAFAKPGNSAEKPSCAVLMFSSDEALSEKISSRYITNRFAEILNQVGVYNLLDQGEMIKKISEGDKSIKKCTDVECAVEQGRLLGMDYVIYGIFGHIGNLYSLETSLVDVKTGNVIQTAVTDFEGEQDEFAQKVPPENLKSLLAMSELPQGVETAAPAATEEAKPTEQEKPAAEGRKFHIGPVIGVGGSDEDLELGGGFEVSYSHLFFRALASDDGIAGGLGYYLHPEGSTPYLALVGGWYEVDRKGGEEDGVGGGVLIGYRLHLIDRLNLNIGGGVGYADWEWDMDKKNREKHPDRDHEDDDQEFIVIGELSLSYLF